MDDGYDGGDYIECTECGHTLEATHGPDGCEGLPDGDGCNCSTHWTRKEIQALRRSHGLVGEWRR